VLRFIPQFGVLIIVLLFAAVREADARPTLVTQSAEDASETQTSPNLPDLEELLDRLKTASPAEASELLFRLAQRTDLDVEQRLKFTQRLWQEPQSIEDRIRGQAIEAEILCEQGRTALALERMQEAIRYTGAPNVHRELLLWTLLKKARIFQNSLEDEAISAAVRCYRLADLYTSNYYRIHARKVLGEIAYSRGAFIRAMEFLEPASNFAVRKANRDTLHRLAVPIASGLLRFGETARSEYLFSLIITDEASDPVLLAEARLGLAAVRLADGAADLAELACRSLRNDLAQISEQTDQPTSAKLIALQFAAGQLLAESLGAQARSEAGLQVLDELDAAECPDPVVIAKLRATRARLQFQNGQLDEALKTTSHVNAAMPDQSVPFAEQAADAELLTLRREIFIAQGDVDAALEAAMEESEYRRRIQAQVEQWQVHLTTLLASTHWHAEHDRVLRGIEQPPRPQPLQPGDVVVASGRPTGSSANQSPLQQSYDWSEKMAAEAARNIVLRTKSQNESIVTTVQLVTGAGLFVFILYLVMNNARRLAQQKARAAEEYRELEQQLNEKLSRELDERTRQLEAELRHREQMERALEQTRKAEAIARLTSGVAHDFNNLMTVVIASNEVLRLKASEHVDNSMVELIDDSTQAARSASDITQQLLAYSKKQPLRPREMGVEKFVRQIWRLLQRTMGDRITCELSIESPQVAFRIDTSQLTTALINLCANARDAISGTGRVIVTVAHEEMNQGEDNWGRLADGEYVVISVADNGQGMTEEQCRRATEPFFTTKTDDKTVAGVGLGLSVVDGFLRQSGGMLRIDSSVGFGTEVSCIIPVVIPEAATDAKTGTDPFTLPVQQILIVDDDGPVRRAIEASLLAHGFETWAASDADEAMDLLETGYSPRLVLTDVRMRGQSSGIDLARWLQDNHPDIRVVLMTGFADQVEGSGFDVISKPFQIAELVERLQVAA